MAPDSRSQETASESDSRIERGLMSSSRRLSEGSKFMVLRVRRTPVTVALGGDPEIRSAQASLTRATASPSG